MMEEQTATKMEIHSLFIQLITQSKHLFTAYTSQPVYKIFKKIITGIVTAAGR
jgi:hypothetical protein